MAKKFKTLESWKIAVDLGVYIYEATQKFPKHELYGITSQIRRAVISISTNIAEGSGQNSNKQYINYIHYAIGSTNEVQSLSLIASKLRYFSETDIEAIENSLERIRKLLYGLKSYLKNKNNVYS
jgi:four helix bundle protein